ncbi:sigma factor [Micromonospora sp. WMMD1219]|uniref:sigma factor n=1 Tax=Micromonospora sp. WMMD1219 TaxID=3404115 RepID=UPI003BF5D748
MWRREAPHVRAALLRRYGQPDACEDAVQDAAEAAAARWPLTGVPDEPRAWLIQVAARRLIDRMRAEAARTRRERLDAVREPGAGVVPPVDDDTPVTGADDTLRLLFLCCHPALSRPSQVALTLRAVAGLRVEQIAAAYLVPARTMTQRLSRVAPSPFVTLNQAVAVAMAHGPDVGLALLEPLLADPAMRRHHRLHAVRAHLLELDGDAHAAAEHYKLAARLTGSLPEQRYLNRRLARLTSDS